MSNVHIKYMKDFEDGDSDNINYKQFAETKSHDTPWRMLISILEKAGFVRKEN